MTPRKRTIESVTRGRMPIRVSTRGGRGRAQAEASVSGVALPPVGAKVAAPGDPRIEGIMQALETMRDLIRQQAQNQAAVVATTATTTVATASKAGPAATPVAMPVVAPTEV